MTLIDQLRVTDKNLELFNFSWEEANIEYKKLELDIQELEQKLSKISEQSGGTRVAVEHMLEQRNERIFLLTVHMNKLRQERKGVTI